MNRFQRALLLILATTAAVGTITLAYGAYTYTGNRALHEEYECFE